jgi:hypothetical protein
VGRINEMRNAYNILVGKPKINVKFEIFILDSSIILKGI